MSLVGGVSNQGGLSCAIHWVKPFKSLKKFYIDCSRNSTARHIYHLFDILFRQCRQTLEELSVLLPMESMSYDSNRGELHPIHLLLKRDSCSSMIKLKSLYISLPYGT